MLNVLRAFYVLVGFMVLTYLVLCDLRQLPSPEAWRAKGLIIAACLAFVTAALCDGKSLKG